MKKVGGWGVRESIGHPYRVFERPLGDLESVFYWDGMLNGTADSLQKATFQWNTTPLPSLRSIGSAWIQLKQRFPLLAARVIDDGVLKFEIDEGRLQSTASEEITALHSPSANDVEKLIERIMKGERQLSPDLLARVYVISSSSSPQTFDICILAAHCITDGIANTTALRTFLDILSDPTASLRATRDLSVSLSLAVPSEQLWPVRSTATARWRKVVGQVIHMNREKRIVGGHTLPRRFTPSLLTSLAVSNYVVTSFTPEESLDIIRNCRKNSITFGNAYPVVAQVAMTRLLCRKYLAGEITQDEWTFRRQQPMHSAGPVNLRPYLDQTWYKNGGFENVALSISFFLYTLPFMPLGDAANLRVGDPLPDYGVLLTSKRFFYRCHLIKEQAEKQLRNALFLEIGAARIPARILYVKAMATAWREGTRPDRADDTPVPVQKQAEMGPVISHGGSSFGNLDALVPLEYPIQRPTKKPPSLLLQSSATHLRCRPGELYLGAATSRGALRLNVFWDGNMFDQDVVHEWIEEVKSVTSWFLGRRAGEQITYKL